MDEQGDGADWQMGKASSVNRLYTTTPSFSRCMQWRQAMAIAILIETPGLTQEQYDAAAQRIDQAGPFDGWLTHIAGPIDDGWRIVDVWTSQAAADAAYGSDALSCKGSIICSIINDRVHSLARHRKDIWSLSPFRLSHGLVSPGPTGNG